MATNFNAQVQRSEFIYPELIGNDVIELAQFIRKVTNRPMFFSVIGSNKIEGRDARPNHNGMSLHRPFINHEESSRRGYPVLDDTFPCRALDFHFKYEGAEDYIDLYLKLSPMIGAGGFGMYPWWGIPGFHIDTRYDTHPSAYARWYSFKDGDKVVYTYSVGTQDLAQIEQLLP